MKVYTNDELINSLFEKGGTVTPYNNIIIIKNGSRNVLFEFMGKTYNFDKKAIDKPFFVTITRAQIDCNKIWYSYCDFDFRDNHEKEIESTIKKYFNL